ncbi:MAG: Na/Pi cotransporter family protein [Bacteroides sp.]|nr:Na/Pi cotransporter family protein [Eubacterium sp.]MCM1419403.1 Na/Pi cotransporter family protein [Roseburia sp.]MCM1463241.1 Na/Pi cotransporter family protein [Bacteroides sp.]
MSIFDILSLLGGLALFLYGMNNMGAALEKKAGGKLKAILGSFTSNQFKGFLLGLTVTAVIQSSSATTVMVVGFVNSGIITLHQAIGVIMGANVGTSVTSWLLSLAGVEGESFWIRLLKPSSFIPVFAFAAILMMMLFKKDSRKKDTAAILMSFAILMYGMEMMSSAVSGLKDIPEFTEILIVFSNPILGVLAGTVITAVIQSSSASVGILQALSLTGKVTGGTAVPIIMGQNIGTCITAMISSVSANKNAKRAAVIHLSINVIGTIFWLSIYCIVTSLVDVPFVHEAMSPLGIAIIHTTFSLLKIGIQIPFTGALEKLSCLIVRDGKKKDEDFALLDERLLSTPSIAIEQSRTIALKMAETAVKALKRSFTLLFDYSEKGAAAVREGEDKTDKYEDSLGTFLVRLSSKSMSEADSHEVSKLLHMIGDFERIGDHAVNIVESADEIHDKKLSFSMEAGQELTVMLNAVSEILDLSLDAFRNNDLEKAYRVEPLEQTVDSLKLQLKSSHVARLRRQECTIEMGFVLSDLLTNLERVSDHCSNIAACMIEIAHDSFEMHEYILRLNDKHNKQYKERCRFYLEKYSLKNLHD